MRLVIAVAHPDDELLGTAGVIAAAVRSGHRVQVAIATNGDAWRDRDYGLRRQAESLAGLQLLGVAADAVHFLGYPDTPLGRLPWLGVAVRGRRGERALRRHLGALVAHADEVYTHVPFDGHADHAALARIVIGAASPRARVWGTLMHPPGAGSCLELSASCWPAPAGEPHERFLPAAEVEAPPSPACAAEPEATSWGPLGPPPELREVPAEMQALEEAANLKWQAIACHASQTELGAVSAGYLRAFVRRHEFFWRLAA